MLFVTSHSQSRPEIVLIIFGYKYLKNKGYHILNLQQRKTSKENKREVLPYSTKVKSQLPGDKEYLDLSDEF